MADKDHALTEYLKDIQACYDLMCKREKFQAELETRDRSCVLQPKKRSVLAE